MTLLLTNAKCLSRDDGLLVLKEAHEGDCAENVGARSLARKVMRAGFYWPTMKKDVEKIVKECEACQKHGPRIHVPATEMIVVTSPCPFARWGIDIVGPSSKRKKINIFW